MEERIEQLERALNSGGNSDSRPSSVLTHPFIPQPSKNSSSDGAAKQSQAAASANLPNSSNDFALNLSCSLGAFPASSLRNATSRRCSNDPDLISNNVISLESAEDHFKFYQEKLNPHIHYIIAEQDSLAHIRARSPLLTAAICATAAYCTGSLEYQTCIEAYTKEVSSKMFSGNYIFDDVRALCIGAFWINDKSYALNALGIL
jgi:hypothetical protein